VAVYETRVEAGFDLPRAIVWDAIADADLVSGWLAEATIEPRPGGIYRLAWQPGARFTGLAGSIAEMVEPERLVIATEDGSLEFRLHDVAGGPRGTSTRLVVTLPLAPTGLHDAGEEARLRALWRCSLDQLGELLRGHPVDWQRWDEEWAPVWSRYLSEETGPTASSR
jgi:uncharacterized protein YndB with AHSA1/START domain